MKIEGNRSNPVADAPATTQVIDRTAPSETPRPGTGADSVALSHDAALLAAATKDAAREAPIRQELVDARKAEIDANGGLSVDAGQLADLLIDDLLDR